MQDQANNEASKANNFLGVPSDLDITVLLVASKRSVKSKYPLYQNNFTFIKLFSHAKNYPLNLKTVVLRSVISLVNKFFYTKCSFAYYFVDEKFLVKI